MKAFNVERVLDVHHWNDTLFSFKTTRDPALRFRNGHFVMIGLEVDGRPLMQMCIRDSTSPMLSDTPQLDCGVFCWAVTENAKQGAGWHCLLYTSRCV